MNPTCLLRLDNVLGEAPVWCRRSKRLWWTDVYAAALHSLEPESGDHKIYSFPAKFLGSIALRARGGLILALDSTIHGFDPETGKLELIAQPEPEARGNRLNDAKCDRLGRFWIGTMDRHIKQATGAFYRIDADHSVQRMFDDVLTPNSVAFSPDDRRLYFADTRRFKIWTFAFDLASGELSDRQVFVDTTGHPGRPDGSTVDAQGYLWNAEFAGGRIVRYAPDGRIDRVVSLPVSQPTSLAFGGDDLRTLYITTARLFLTEEELHRQPLAGSLFALRLDVGGIPEPAYAG